MKWSWGKSNKTNDDAEEQENTMNSKALVKQDPRTKVKTTSAQSETSNTTTQNATIFNNNAKTITFQTTKQTVTSRQTARITEITTRRTPTPQELEEMMRLLAMNKKAETKTFTTTSTTSSVPLRRNRPSNLPALPSTSRNSINSLNNKSTPKFKNTAASPVSRLIFSYESQPGSGGGDGPKTPTTPTLVKTQTTTVSEKNGRTITQRVEEHRIKLDPKTFKLSTPNSPLTRNYMGEDSFTTRDAQPFRLPALPAPSTTSSSSSSLGGALKKPASSGTSSYTSPYSNKQYSTTSALGKTTASKLSFLNSNSNSKPSSTTTSLTFSTTSKPISSISSRITQKPSSSTLTSSTTKPGSLFSSWSGPSSSTAKADAKPFSRTAATTTTTSPLFSSFPRTTTTTTSPSFSSSFLNSRPITTTATTPSNGKIETGPRLKPGYAYIFNNVVFDNPSNEERIGSAEDVKALVQTFEFYKMKVTVIENAKVDKVKKTVEKIQTKDFTEYACLVIVILSHGNRHEEIAAKDGHYSIDDHVLFPILRNTTLNDKPKMFFIQACKGSMESKGYYTDATPFTPPGSANEILKCYSTFEGFVSYRTEKGSIFIQSLCQNLKLFGSTKNIKDIMETVTLLVKKQSMNKQIPAYTSTLTKPFVFGDYVKWAK